MPGALCRKCGTILDKVLLAEGADRHPNCEPRPPLLILAEDIASDLKDVIRWTDNNSARSLQSTIGPSELGDPCERRIAYRLAGVKEVNEWADPWPAIVGTAIHGWLERAIGTFQSVHHMDRWVTESTVRVDDLVSGHVDLFDRELHTIIDFKAQPDWELILTPSGWRTLGDLVVGDSVIGSSGEAVTVVGVYPQGEKEVFEVVTTDGGCVTATGDHLWTLGTMSGATPRTLTTFELAAELDKSRPGRRVLPALAPVIYAKQAPLSLDPYALGLLLGDGSFRGKSITFTNSDGLEACLPFDCHKVQQADGRAPTFVVRGAVEIIRNLGVHGELSTEKHVPPQFLTATPDERLALLQGLLDTDGTVSKGNAVLTTSSARMAEDVVNLVRSLGGKVFRFTDKVLRPGATALAHLLSIKLPEGACPFRADLPHKKGRWRKGANTHLRHIKEVRHAGVAMTRCIKVDAPDQLYVTRDFILTHNTMSPTKMKDFKSKGPSEQHIDQINLYGLGMVNAGERVDNVCLVALPRAGWLGDMKVWVGPYEPERAHRVLKRMYDIAGRMLAQGPELDFAAIPAVPGKGCSFCAWYVGGDRDPSTAGCPGNSVDNMSRFNAGLVA